MAVGFVFLLRHQASLGDINILVQYLQGRHGFRTEKLQMTMDVLIVLTSLLMVSPMTILASVLGHVTLNLAIALNHRLGRYMET